MKRSWNKQKNEVLIEFLEGSLQGVVLPLGKTLNITGGEKRKDIQEEEYLVAPEILKNDEELSIKNEESRVIVILLNGKKKLLKENIVYSFSGIVFFVYVQGNRNPKSCLYWLRKNITKVFSLATINMVLLFSVYYIIDTYNNSRFNELIQSLNGSYIEDGRVKLPISVNENALPDEWKKISDKLPYIRNIILSPKLGIKIISKENQSLLSYTMADQKNYTLIKVDTKFIENKVMKVFGAAGLRFRSEDGYWYVDDPNRAEKELKKNDLDNVVSQLRSFVNNNGIISKEEFPYSVFYSSHSSSYIYNQSVRYWEGGEVPGLGTIISVSKNKVTFLYKGNERVFYMN
ncbi:hypothetical protein [Vibrio coralliilyticus]|uniref:hypothetical protein n=1 Tax=Vibrio coralliilyticus TaxID=190893 RepID=UPI00185E6B09|nr:hypothetical protein [Vibrio coralliilyticus]NUW68059.1 hypothetical protein [Vibrio coralliilyticus]